MGGEWIEFQASNLLGLDNVEFWMTDSIYLMAISGAHEDIFRKYLPDDWWLGFNQLRREEALKLADVLEDIPDGGSLSKWIKTNIKGKSYLNVLGV